MARFRFPAPTCSGGEDWSIKVWSKKANLWDDSMTEEDRRLGCLVKSTNSSRAILGRSQDEIGSHAVQEQGDGAEFWFGVEG